MDDLGWFHRQSDAHPGVRSYSGSSFDSKDSSLETVLSRTVVSTIVTVSAVPWKKASTGPLPIVSTPKKGAADRHRKAPTLLEATDARAPRGRGRCIRAS